MEGENHENEAIDEVLGDGEVVDGEEAIEFVFLGISAHDGEQMLFWEYKVCDMTFELDYVLEIPRDMSHVFVDRNQRNIMIIDRDTNERYRCEISLNVVEKKNICVGNGWNNFVKSKPLEKGDTLLCVLYDDNPYNLHVCLADRLRFFTMSPANNDLNKMKAATTNGVHAFLNDLSGVTSKSTIKHNYIHGTIPSRSASAFKDVLQEGKVYEIGIFRVSRNKRTYIIVENNTSMLQFSGSTTFTPQEYDDGKIPRYVFEFVPFEELHKRFNKEAHADVIGVIIDMTPIEERTTAYGKSDIMSLYLRNKSGDIFKVTLWGDFVSMFDKKFKQYKHAALEPNVAIFTSILVKQFQGEFLVQSSRSTTIYINIDIPEAIELAQASKAANVMDENANLSPLAVRPKIDKVKTLSEILDIAAAGDNMSAVYHCAATVEDILVKNGWYYVSCPECRKTVFPTETDFHCDNCKVDVAYPKTRFRLELQVKDPTASTIFVLFDDVAEQVVQVKLADLTSNLEKHYLMENVKDSELPEQLLKIIGTTHVFQIRMGSYFESRGRQSFTANKILKPVVKVEEEDTKDEICSSSSEPPTIKTPIPAQKRRRLILHSSPESGNMDQKDIAEDLHD
ncbi:replication protein A 70 kDa DNA-binding subunit A [Trifolium repens]|nr:replication protein A 70 kDa DNA-binding subunit A [Trifolium repens]